MEVSELADKLHSHEGKSQERYHMTMEAIDKHHHAEMKRMEELEECVEELEDNEVTAMDGRVNVFEGGGMGGAGAGMAGGLGSGLLGGILGGALLGGGGGLFGRNGVGTEGVVTPTQLTAALTGVQDQNSFSALMQGQARIEASIPAAEGQVQLALAQAQGQISNQIGQQSLAIAQGFSGTNQSISQAQAAVIAVGEANKDAINANGTANLMATANSQFTISQTIRDDGDKTRALIVAQNEAALRNEITALQIRLGETQNEARARGTEVNVSQVVNQNQAQSQAQAQAQAQGILLNSIWHRLDGMQQAIATNSNMIIGNTGAVATGPNNANPINVAR